MHLRLKTKITLTTALLVFAGVFITALLDLGTVTSRSVRSANDDAHAVAQEIFLQAQHALADAANEGTRPESSAPEDVREYVRKALDQSEGLTAQVENALAHSPTIYEISIVDRRGTVLISSDATLPGRISLHRAPLDDLVKSNFLRQLRVIYGPPSVYEVTLPIQIAGQLFGEIRVASQTGLLRADVQPALRSAGLILLIGVPLATILAALVSSASFAPLALIFAQADAISKGQFDQKPIQSGDEFGQVSTKINEIGQQLRGVREIFSTLRENLNQVMAGLEDGLLLFTRDGRAVMISPAVEKFLGTPSDQLLGRRAAEIFPPGHPLHQILRLDGEAPAPLATTEFRLAGPGDPAGPSRRISVSAQAIPGEGDHAAGQMGALVTLRDLESLDRIGSELQVSERLAALGRVTAGVAHEVKNPLNSMRLWLENLKESLATDSAGLPAEANAGAKQAVAVLDSEIDRLDRVVKRFLDFTRPVELHLEETQLADLLGEILSVARPQIERAGVQAESEFAADVPPARVDRGLIKQAILNLLLNAAEATPAGGRITVRLARRGDLAEVSVADTGRGIAPEYRARIFQLFFTTRKDGSGIGLASTFRIVQLHNGSIDFDSEAGRGTTFRIELPLAHPVESTARAGRVLASKT
jgi:signal transduction histidine kinase